MRAHEFVVESSAADAVLLSVISNLRQQAQSRGEGGRVSTDTVINLVKNTGQEAFDYAGFVEIYQRSSALQNLIDNFNQQYVTLVADQDDSEITSGPTDSDSEARVGQMAQKAVDL
jgi:hypothetical protein